MLPGIDQELLFSISAIFLMTFASGPSSFTASALEGEPGRRTAYDGGVSSSGVQ